jgi:hypothetical protein
MYLVVVAQPVVAGPKHMYTMVSPSGIASNAYGHKYRFQSTGYACPEGSQIPELIYWNTTCDQISQTHVYNSFSPSITRHVSGGKPTSQIARYAYSQGYQISKFVICSVVGPHVPGAYIREFLCPVSLEMHLEVNFHLISQDIHVWKGVRYQN